MNALAVLAVALSANPAAPPDGFVPLFNGKDLAGWKSTGKSEGWAAENGMIVCKGKGGGYLLTEKEYADFELRFEFRWEKAGGNSGVGLRTPFKGDPAYAGMEIQLIDDEGWEAVHKSKLQPWQHSGSIYNVQPATGSANKPVGEWNAVRIVCDKRAVVVEFNGKELTNAKLDDYADQLQKHPGLARKTGLLGFQTHDGRVEFRNVYLKELK